MSSPEELNAQGIEYCQHGNLTKGIDLFREALINIPRPGNHLRSQ
jgi:hypothetical protein